MTHALKSQYLIDIVTNIKLIQARMKMPDLRNKEYAIVYSILSNEFPQFSDENPSVFVKVIRGEDLTTTCKVLYYRDQVDRGLMKESDLSDKLAAHFLPADLKAESDRIMRQQNNKK